jgi:hypothetical protein
VLLDEWLNFSTQEHVTQRNGTVLGQNATMFIDPGSFKFVAYNNETKVPITGYMLSPNQYARFNRTGQIGNSYNFKQNPRYQVLMKRITDSQTSGRLNIGINKKKTIKISVFY